MTRFSVSKGGFDFSISAPEEVVATFAEIGVRLDAVGLTADWQQIFSMVLGQLVRCLGPDEADALVSKFIVAFAVAAAGPPA